MIICILFQNEKYYFATKATEHALRSALNNELGIYHAKLEPVLVAFSKVFSRKLFL